MTDPLDIDPAARAQIRELPSAATAALAGCASGRVLPEPRAKSAPRLLYGPATRS